MKRIITFVLALVMLTALTSCGRGRVKFSDDEFRSIAREYFNSDSFTNTLIKIISENYAKCDEVLTDITTGGVDIGRYSEGFMVCPYSLSVNALKDGASSGRYTCLCEIVLNEDTGEVGVLNGEKGITLKESAD